MPRTEQSRDIPLVTQPSDIAPAAEAPPESLDKVRDILFGGQMRAVESRIQNLDERIRQEQDSMRTKLERTIADLESSTRQELRALEERLTTERAKRGEEIRALSEELTESIRQLAARHDRLDESTGAADAELRDMLLQHSTAVAAEIERLSQRLTTELQREVSGLRADKLDIASMQSMFSDMAGRLGDSRAPASNGPRS